MTNSTCAVTWEAVTERRLHRVGTTPVLEASVTYPCFEAGDGMVLAAAERMTAAYRRMAEAFLGFAAEGPAQAAAEAYAALGPGASYRFDRRLLTCRMVPTGNDAVHLTVCRTVFAGSRRGSIPGRQIVDADCWHLPEGLLMVYRRPRHGLPHFPAAKTVEPTPRDFT